MRALAMAAMLWTPMQEIVARLHQRVDLPLIGPVPAGTAILGLGAGLLAAGWLFLRRK
jgi:Asp/Glu/hydantoin racemase